MRCDHELLIPGAVVRSLCGRDKKRIFLVVGVTDVSGKIRLLVTDGRLRRISEAKLKNPRHVRFIASLTADESAELGKNPTDSTVRRLLSAYDKAVPHTETTLHDAF